MSSRVVHLHVDRIVVDGLPASAQQRFIKALKSGLTEMAENGIPPGLSVGKRSISSLDAGQLPRGASGERAAGQVLRAIQQNLSSARVSNSEAKGNG
jgi:hypothetical protein